jgi:catechol 2,3-dioxygenase-like lactoylglutathione lyase family enzyme
MITPTYTILYVDRPQASARLYAAMLGAEPVEASPTFILFMLEHGRILGLWAKSGVKPASDFTGSGSELAFKAADSAEVDRLHDAWQALGLRIVQAPQVVDFGYTFAGEDPDGHRVRVFARSE